MRNNECTLVSASCTTGWTDWVHGELWLCPGGLLRRSLGLAHTIWRGFRHGAAPTVTPSVRSTRSFTPAEIQAISRANKRNRWVPWEAIAAAEAKRGPLTDFLHLNLHDGQRLKFLWLRVDQAMDPITEVVGRYLGRRFVSLSRR